MRPPLAPATIGDMETKNMHDERPADDLSGKSLLVLAGLSVAFGVGAIAAGLLFSAIWYAWGALAAILMLVVVVRGYRYLSARRARTHAA